ncbi:hypothetical protein [Bizionia sp. M204]|uniref:hypothetical protein n=1 Tax=Bizionia sp. M204 TaxID=2675331 RepID=UPI0020457BA3|nr:hypothetical protein [Bizionia sp. M204]UPS91197.1 hypothetical protein GMA17_05430 [Bizionia sp. M204]
MNEFLSQNYFLITHSVEFLAAGTGLFFYKKYKSTAVIYFIWFLLYSAILDLTFRYPSFFKFLDIYDVIKGTIFQQNYWFTTIFWVMGSTIFYVLYFQKIIHEIRLKNVLKLTKWLFIILSILFLIIDYKVLYTRYIPIIHIMSTLAVVLAISLYLYEILNSDTILNFYKSINFYISAIVLIWWLITTPLVFFEIYSSTSDWNFVFLKWQIFLFANVFMYVTFTLALIFCKPQYD